MGRRNHTAEKSNVRPVLRKECIFCKTVSKYTGASKTREKLTLSADDEVRRVALYKCDQQLIFLPTEELVAKEAYYHRSCYSGNTIALYHHDRHNTKNESSITDIAFSAIERSLANVYEKPEVVEF